MPSRHTSREDAMSHRDSSGSSPDLRIERVFPDPIERVFAALTDPMQMARWFFPQGWAEVEADVVVSGRLHVVMLDDDVRIEHTGEYLEVDPPNRLSFTWSSPYTGSVPSVVTIQLTPDRGGTRLVLEHARLPEGAADSHEGGWTAILDRLAGFLRTVRDGS